ncbi:MAG: DUF3795 domain-containing protein [Coriobacteriia bacterium]|nr:DUF3795 domain-containing protein [Coriobacteriia bacterium]
MLLAPCGIDCETCDYFKDCSGCHAIEGKPFYLQDFEVEVCPLYDCPVNQKGLKTCGECAELPCKIFFDWRDPSMSDEDHLKSIDDRVKVLKESQGAE